MNKHLMDSVTAFFETGTAILVWTNVRWLLKDKVVRGVWWPGTLFNVLWGFWGFVIYVNFGWKVSLVMLIIKLLGQFTWIGLVLHYNNHANRARI